MRFTKQIRVLVAGFAVALVLPAVALAADTTTVITGNTSDAEHSPGWMFNRDTGSDTPFEFNEDKFSIGEGSLYVKPIGATPADKFVAENFLRTPVNEVDSISYDFLVAGDGTAADSDKFYMNVYATLGDTTKFYDCRYDYEPVVDGSTANFTTASFLTTATPTTVSKSNSSTLVGSCPATLAGMPENSYIRAFSINVGGSSASDEGLAGYLDNVRVAYANSDVTIYDFEQAPTKLTSKEACKEGGWMTSENPEFKNQGECVSSFASSKNKSQDNPSVIERVRSFFSF